MMKKIDSEKIIKEWELKPIAQEQINVLKYMDIKFSTNITRKEATDIIHETIEKRKKQHKITPKAETFNNIWKK